MSKLKKTAPIKFPEYFNKKCTENKINNSIMINFYLSNILLYSHVIAGDILKNAAIKVISRIN